MPQPPQQSTKVFILEICSHFGHNSKVHVPAILLTLGMHALRLLYLSCVCVCVCVGLLSYGVKHEHRSQYANEYGLPRSGFAFVRQSFVMRFVQA